MTKHWRKTAAIINKIDRVCYLDFTVCNIAKNKRIPNLIKTGQLFKKISGHTTHIY